MNKTISHIPYKNANGNIWISWHKALRKRYGRKSANELFRAAFEKRVDTTISNFLELQKYMETQGVKLEGTFWQEMQRDWNEGFDTFSSTLKVTGLTVGIILLVVLFVLLYALVNISRNPQGFAQLASQVKPI